MLSKSDLESISQIVSQRIQEETPGIVDHAIQKQTPQIVRSIIQEETPGIIDNAIQKQTPALIQKEIAPLKNRIDNLEKNVFSRLDSIEIKLDRTIEFFDKEHLKLKKSVRKIQDHLGLAT